MTIVQTVSPQQASDKVGQIYAQIEQRFGRIPNGFQLYSANCTVPARNCWSSYSSRMLTICNTRRSARSPRHDPHAGFGAERLRLLHRLQPSHVDRAWWL
jgi:hypothetical protein